jgi:hypothetical protein
MYVNATVSYDWNSNAHTTAYDAGKFLVGASAGVIVYAIGFEYQNIAQLQLFSLPNGNPYRDF